MKKVFKYLLFVIGGYFLYEMGVNKLTFNQVIEKIKSLVSNTTNQVTELSQIEQQLEYTNAIGTNSLNEVEFSLEEPPEKEGADSMTMD